MWLVKFLLAAVFAIGVNANGIRVNNTGTENLVFWLEAVGHEAENVTVVEAGNYYDFLVLNEWEGSFFTYPEECLSTTCDYPVTKIRVAFERYMFGSLYDFLIVDLNQGFNVPASIKSATRDDCEVRCDANLLELCPEEDQVKNEQDVLVACATTVRDYQDFQKQCPQARVDGSDLAMGICASMSYEITFG